MIYVYTDAVSCLSLFVDALTAIFRISSTWNTFQNGIFRKNYF